MCFLLTHSHMPTPTYMYRDDFDISYTLSDARREKRKVEERKAKLWELIREDGYEYGPITHFYHVTSSMTKDTILEGKHLKRKQVSLYQESVDSPAHKKLKGVFFMCSLRNGNYPTISPFGTQRVKIPIRDFFVKGGFELFFNSFNFTRRNNCYAVMVMVRRRAPEYNFCRDHLVPLDFKRNEFLRLDLQHNTYSCCQTKGDMKLWLELIVVDDVPIEDEYEWDTVSKFGKFH